MPWGAAIGAAGSIAGGMISSSGAKKAAKEQEKATKAALEEERRQYDVARGDLAPWRTTGGAAITRLGDLMGLTSQAPVGDARYEELVKGLRERDDAAHTAQYGYSLFDPKSWYISRGDVMEKMDRGWADEATRQFVDKYGQSALDSAAPRSDDYGALTRKFTTDDFYADPVTQLSLKYGQDMGERAISNMARATGTMNTGGTLKSLLRFGQDYAGSKAADSYSRFVNDQTNLYNRLAGIAGSGQTAVNTGVAAGQNTANTIAGLTTAQGNARGASSIAQGNAWGGALQNIGNIFGNAGGTSMYNGYQYNPAQFGGGDAWQ